MRRPSAIGGVNIRADTDGDRGRLAPTGSFDLDHAPSVVLAIKQMPPGLERCLSIDVDLAHLDRFDGSGAVLLAELLDRLETNGHRTHILEDSNPEAARLIALYRGRPGEQFSTQARRTPLARIGAAAAKVPGTLHDAFDLAGRVAVAVPRAVTAPRSVDWWALPGLVQEIGADGLIVTGAANLLVGLIIGLLGISQLARFGAVAYVPELVVVAQFRELGPLVTAIVVAGRSGAGLASELATMKVSEEIDALRSMGFDPMRWLVVPRCIALVAVVPLLTWIGDGLGLLGRGPAGRAESSARSPRRSGPGSHHSCRARNGR